MVEKGNSKLSIGKQCKLLSISRSSFYYQPKGETALNLALMREIDDTTARQGLRGKSRKGIP